MCLFSISVLYQCLQIYAKPFIDKTTHKITLFNEIAVSIYLLAMLTLTEPVPMKQELKEYLGWVLASLIAAVVTVNIGKIAICFTAATF
jgi:hypothetical protein